MTFEPPASPGVRSGTIRSSLQHDAGHVDFATTEEYLHLGESRRKGFGEVFPGLPSELIELQASEEAIAVPITTES